MLQRLGETHHQSCLLLISTEKPQEFFCLEGERLPVHSLSVQGIKPAEAQKITQFQGNFSGSEADWQTLTNNYGGNPLALKFIAATIKNLFSGSIKQFLAQKTLSLNHIDDLLNKQISRLSPVERQILSAIAIKNKPISFQELQQDLLNYISTKESIEGIESLQGRSLIQEHKSDISLHPYIQEYVINELTEIKTDATSAIIPLPLYNPTPLWSEVQNFQVGSIYNCLNSDNKSCFNNYCYWNFSPYPAHFDGDRN